MLVLDLVNSPAVLSTWEPAPCAPLPDCACPALPTSPGQLFFPDPCTEFGCEFPLFHPLSSVYKSLPGISPRAPMIVSTSKEKAPKSSAPTSEVPTSSLQIQNSSWSPFSQFPGSHFLRACPLLHFP